MQTESRTREILEFRPPPAFARTSLGNVLLGASVFVGTAALIRSTGGEAWLWVLLGFSVLWPIRAAVARLRSRRRRQRVQEAARRGRSPCEADWTGARDLLRHGVLDAPLPVAWDVCARILVAAAVPLCFSWPSWGVRSAAAVTPVTLLVGLWAWTCVRGGVQVRLARFPYFVGERVLFHLATTAGAPTMSSTTVRLRCESPEPRATRSDPPHVVRRYWDGTVRLAADLQPGPDEFVEVAFDLPPDVPGTSLNGERLVRWELVVSGSTRYGDLEETFLVPVYAPPN